MGGLSFEEMENKLYGDETIHGWLKGRSRCLRKISVTNVCDAGIADRWLTDIELLCPQFAAMVWKCSADLGGLTSKDCSPSKLPSSKQYGVYGPRVIVNTYSMLESAFRPSKKGGPLPWIARVKLGLVADEVQAFKNMMRFKSTTSSSSSSSTDPSTWPSYLRPDPKKNKKNGDGKDGKDYMVDESAQIVESGLMKGRAVMKLNVAWMTAVSGTPITSNKSTEGGVDCTFVAMWFDESYFGEA